MISRFLGLLLVILASSALAEEAPSPAPEKVVPRAEITDRHCLDCHGVKGFAVPTGEHGDTAKRPLHVDHDALKDSVHGKAACLACHTDIDKLPHKKGGLDKVDCVACHQSQHKESPELLREINMGRALVGMVPDAKPTPRPVARFADKYLGSLHGKPRKDDPKRPNAGCQDCHGTHYVLNSKDHRALSNRLQSPEVCGSCHPKALELYRGSVHGAALKTPWKGKSATCGDCHTAHEVSEAKGLTARRTITEKCGDCHKNALDSYMNTYHGQLAWLGGKDVAKCHDCHRPHDTRKVDDPQSRIGPANKLATCKACHKDATASFAEFEPHANTEDFARYPAMWLVAKGMVALVVGVLIFFYGHSYLWFRRERREQRELAAAHMAGTAAAGKPLHAHETGHLRRFSWGWRLNHWLLALSVMTLVLTGMTSMFADSFWAVRLVETLGGPERFAVAHRVAAAGFLLAVLGHTAAVLYKVLVAEKGRFQWFGPDSLLPRRKDWQEMKDQFRWFLGKGPKPRFDRWTYWEKFDYWAVYWGAGVIGLSGLVLWFPGFFARFLPGWMFNVATLAHGVEAFLAVATLFVVHFFNNHFRPGKFPLDTVMFVGSWDAEEFKEERPAEYERLAASGELESRRVAPPSRRADILSHVLGFTLIGIGLLLLGLVAIGFVQKVLS